MAADAKATCFNKESVLWYVVAVDVKGFNTKIDEYTSFLSRQGHSISKAM
jgi:hypothetical protein